MTTHSDKPRVNADSCSCFAGAAPVLKERVCVRPKHRHSDPALLALGPGCHTQVTGHRTVVHCVCTTNLCNTQNSPSNIPGRPESAEAMLRILSAINRIRPVNTKAPPASAVVNPKSMFYALDRRVRDGDAQMQASAVAAKPAGAGVGAGAGAAAGAGAGVKAETRAEAEKTDKAKEGAKSGGALALRLYPPGGLVIALLSVALLR